MTTEEKTAARKIKFNPLLKIGHTFCSEEVHSNYINLAKFTLNNLATVHQNTRIYTSNQFTCESSFEKWIRYGPLIFGYHQFPNEFT